MKHSVVLSLPLSRQSSYLASFPGPTQLSVPCSTEKFFVRVRGEPGSEATPPPFPENVWLLHTFEMILKPL